MYSNILLKGRKGAGRNDSTKRLPLNFDNEELLRQHRMKFFNDGLRFLSNPSHRNDLSESGNWLPRYQHIKPCYLCMTHLPYVVRKRREARRYAFQFIKEITHQLTKREFRAHRHTFVAENSGIPHLGLMFKKKLHH